jgi:hypothetical protein
VLTGLAVFVRQPTGEDVDQNCNRAGHQRGDDDTEADDENIDIEPVGEASTHTHDLGAVAVDDKAVIHSLVFLRLSSALGDRQRGGSRNEQKRRNQRGGKAGSELPVVEEREGHFNYSLF